MPEQRPYEALTDEQLQVQIDASEQTRKYLAAEQQRRDPRMEDRA